MGNYKRNTKVIGRETLNKYLKLIEPPVKDSSCIIDNYMSLIKKIIVDKMKTKEIYQTMKDAGYKGKMTVLNMHMKTIKQEIKNNTTYLNRNKELSNLIDIIKDFKTTLFSKKTEELNV